MFFCCHFLLNSRQWISNCRMYINSYSAFSKIDTINELGYNLAVKGGQSALKINELQISFLTEKNIQWNQI